MAPARPNIIFIMADDHAAKSISAYGAGINSTPNIDRLGSEGMRFDHCYVTNSICTPSRATILTGTHNHVNGVTTLDSKINKHIPNVAKHLRTGGYQTAMIGKWHLGEGIAHEPSGFDHWSILPGQGDYFDPTFLEAGGKKEIVPGYATDIITDKSIVWMQDRDRSKPFFLMCHHKAPHRSWECDPKHKGLYTEDIKVPNTFNDDYANRAKAISYAKMRVAEDLTYYDLGLVEPEGGREVGEQLVPGHPRIRQKKVPFPDDVTKLRFIDKDTAEVFTFKTREGLKAFKYQRYMKRYLRTIHSIDENVGRMLEYLKSEGKEVEDNTVVIYTSDQGFFLGDHALFDKRFIYEDSFQMPFLIRYPALIAPGSVSKHIISNVDFAATWLDMAGLRIPTYMQGRSFVPLLRDQCPDDWKEVAYHRYWMHGDMFHDAAAHYGIRTQRYKLIYWYNKGLEQPGSREGGELAEWEMFDCEKDPDEMLNVYAEKEYAKKVAEMKSLLAEVMMEIGDEPEH